MPIEYTPPDSACVISLWKQMRVLVALESFLNCLAIGFGNCKRDDMIKMLAVVSQILRKFVAY